MLLDLLSMVVVVAASAIVIGVGSLLIVGLLTDEDA